MKKYLAFMMFITWCLQMHCLVQDELLFAILCSQWMTMFLIMIVMIVVERKEE